MKLLTFLFILGSLSLGFAGGMAFMAIFYKSLIKDLRAENRKLRSSNTMLKKSKKDTVEVIYSTGFDGETTTDCPDDYYPDFSKNW